MPTGLRALPVYPFEWIAVALTLAVFTFLATQGRFPTWAAITYTLRISLWLLPQALLLGVAMYAYYRFMRRAPVRAYLREVLTPAWLILWLRLWVAVWLISFSYFWLKVHVPLINTSRWDAALWEIDRIVHLGFQPTELVGGLLGGSFVATALDHWYANWLLTVLFCLAFFVASNEASLRRGFGLSCVLMWGFGAWLYLSVPALGPVYAYPELFEPGEIPPIAHRVQQALWANYQLVLESGLGRPARFDHRLGVAALPSLHVGFHWLFALWARRLWRPLFWPVVAMTLGTFVGSVLTGWHYAVDGYVGVGLASLCFRLACRLELPEDPSRAPAGPTRG